MRVRIEPASSNPMGFRGAGPRAHFKLKCPLIGLFNINKNTGRAYLIPNPALESPRSMVPANQYLIDLRRGVRKENFNIERT